MKCPRCAAENAPGRAKCASCGAALSVADEQATILPGSVSQRGPASESPTLAPLGGGDSPTVISGGPSESATRIGNVPGAAGPGGSLAVGDRIGERYEIQAVLGEGGFGAVYKAYDRTLERTVALKIIRPALASHPEMLERFKREILLASKITHRNVVRIHDLGEAGDLKFISMAFVEGTDLHKIIEREGKLAPERAVSIIRQVAGALEAAHEAGVVHRDLKPQNVLVGQDGTPYIADFGISRSVEQGATMTEAGAVLGTLDYMSPEQARGEQVDHRSDIYSLGLILFEMLTGIRPFKGDNMLSSLMKRVTEDVPAVQTLRPDVPLWLSRIIERAVARDKGERYQSVAEMIGDLERQRATVLRFRRWRGRALKIAAGVVAVALLVVLYRQLPQGTGGAPPAKPLASLILLPFQIATEDPALAWARTGLPDLLRSDLQQSAELNLVGEERVRGVVESLQLGRATSTLDPQSLQRISSVLGVEHLVRGQLFRVGQDYRIDAALLRVGADTNVRETPISVRGKGEEALFAMIDELAQGIRKELGVTGRRGTKKVTELSTSSVDALREYSAGLMAVREGRDTEAEQRLEAAVTADPEFSGARAVLAEVYSRLGKNDQAIAAADAAADNLLRVSPFEAARIRAVRARLKGDVEAAEAAYRELVELAPARPESHIALAELLEATGNLPEARAALERALEIDPKNPDARFLLGRVCFRAGDPARAFQEMNVALGYHDASGNEEGRAEVLHGLGVAHHFAGELDQALSRYRESLAVRERLGDRRAVGSALNNISLVLRDKGQYEEAVANQRQSIALYQDLGDPVGLAGAWSTLGDVYDRWGRTEETLNAYTEALNIQREIGDESNLALSLGNMGYVNSVVGEYTQAYFFLQQALEKRKALGDPTGLLYALIDIAAVDQVQGRHDKALQSYAEATHIAQQLRNQAGLAVLAANLGDLHLDQGDFGAALGSLAEAERITRELEDDNLSTVSQIYLGRARTEIGDWAGAEVAFDAAAERAAEAENEEARAEILIGRGRLRIERGEPSAAVPILRDARAAAQAVRNYRFTLLARLESARAAASATELEAVLAEASAAARRLDPIASRAHLALAQLHLAQGRLDPALEQAQKAIELATKLGERDVRFRAHEVAARVQLRKGRVEEAAAAVAAGLDALEQMRTGLEGDALAAFVARPATTSFAEIAGQVLDRGENAEAKARLAAALAG